MTTSINLNDARFDSHNTPVNNIIQRLQQKTSYAAALLVFAALSLAASVYDIVDTSADGQETGAWVVLWAAALVGMVGFAKFCKRQFVAWLKADREARMWADAMTDYRVMADIRAAQARRQ